MPGRIWLAVITVTAEFRVHQQRVVWRAGPDSFVAVHAAVSVLPGKWGRLDPVISEAEHPAGRPVFFAPAARDPDHLPIRVLYNRTLLWRELYPLEEFDPALPFRQKYRRIELGRKV